MVERTLNPIKSGLLRENGGILELFNDCPGILDLNGLRQSVSIIQRYGGYGSRLGEPLAVTHRNIARSSRNMAKFPAACSDC